MYNALKDGVEVTGVPLVREAIGNGEIHNKMGWVLFWSKFSKMDSQKKVFKRNYTPPT